MDFIKKIYNRITKKDKWKLYLYYNGICIKKIYIDDDFEPMNNFYVVKVQGFKNLFGTNRRIQIMLMFYKYKYTDNDKKSVHIETKIYQGSELTI